MFKKHLPINTNIRVRGYCERINGLTGVITRRDGEYYEVRLETGEIIYDLYFCDLIENKP